MLGFFGGWLVIGGILLLSVGKRLGWFGGVKPIEVEVKEATKGKITELVTASGEIQPEVEVRVSPEVPGEIIELTIMEGDFVDEGKLLVKIRPDDAISIYEEWCVDGRDPEEGNYVFTFLPDLTEDAE